MKYPIIASVVLIAVCVGILSGAFDNVTSWDDKVSSWFDKDDPVETNTYKQTVYYSNCDDVRAHNADPIRPGDPGFQSKFDRDGDGVGCER